MGLISSIKNRIGRDDESWYQAETVPYDPHYYSQALSNAYWRLVEGDWTLATQALDHDDPSHVIKSLVGFESKVPIGVFEQWAQAEPGAQSLSMLGWAQIRDAWAIRGRTYANHVDPNAWDAFQRGLESAEETLWAAIEQDPNSPEPWIAMLASGRGLSVGLTEIRERFIRANDLAPFRADACEQMLQANCAKWFGTHDKMFEFARWVESHAQAESSARAVLAYAYVEKIFAQDNDDEEQAAILAEPNSSIELQASANRFLAGVPETPGPEHIHALNLYAYAVKACDSQSARLSEELYRRLGDCPTDSPWDYFGDGIGYRFAVVRSFRLSEATRF